MLLNLIVWGYYTNGKVTQEYDTPAKEYHLEPIKASVRVFFISFTDALFARDKHTIVMGYFNIPDISTQILAYRDVTTNMYYVGTNLAMHSGSYNVVINKINSIYENSPTIRFKFIRLIQLLEYYQSENFTGIGIYKHRILKSEVLNSSSSIPTGYAQAQAIFKRDHYPHMGTQVFDGDMPSLPQAGEHEAPDPDN